MAGTEKQKNIPLGGVKTFECPNCGGSVNVRAPGQSLHCACEFCKAVVDLTDENYKIIQKANEGLKYSPRIPLGRRGKLEGITWETIGFMIRCETKWNFRWEEYLLFNPIHGYRFLILSNGHWNLIKMTMDHPAKSKIASQVMLDGKKFKKFESSTAKVEYVLGEFYWRVKIGDKVDMVDLIHPPYLLSLEHDANGRTWSIGEYMDRKEIVAAFGDDVKVPFPTGVAPNQPNKAAENLKKIKPVAIVLILAAIALQVLFGMNAKSQQVFEQSFSVAGVETTFVTPPFVLEGKSSNIEVILQSSVDNNWMEVEGNLSEKGTGNGFGFLLGTEYYHGVSQGESWTEGDKSGNQVINSIPGGEYEMVIKAASGNPAMEVNFKLKIVRDVSLFSNFLIAILIFSLYPIILVFAKSSFEKQRWGEDE